MRSGRQAPRLLGVIALMAFLQTAIAQGATRLPITYVMPDEAQAERVIDVRPAAQCRAATLPGARCLPLADLLGPQRRLANISGLLWLLGSSGLDGSERLLLIGEQLSQQELVAGLLYLAGQREVSILNAPLSQLAADGVTLQPGRPRSKTRERVYQAPMRDRQVLLRSELQRMLIDGRELLLLDGRSDSEYWGQRIRGMRGGHIPGAQLIASAALRNGQSPLLPAARSGVEMVAYGHDTAEGLIYLARLVAHGLAPRLLLDGWAGWAADGVLPADSLTYRDRPVAVAQPAPLLPLWSMVLLVLLSLGLFFVIGFYLGRYRGRGC